MNFQDLSGLDPLQDVTTMGLVGSPVRVISPSNVGRRRLPHHINEDFEVFL